MTVVDDRGEFAADYNCHKQGGDADLHFVDTVLIASDWKIFT